MSRWRDLSERLEGKAPPGARRSSRWRQVRDDFLRGKSCLVCGGKKSLIAHHKIPFHLAPDLELVASNLMPLCEAKRYGLNCHLLLGHHCRWQHFNPNVEAEVAYWRAIIQGPQSRSDS